MTSTLRRVRSEYSDLPGLRLTLRQAERLFHIDSVVCKVVFDALVDDHFLDRGADGAYAQVIDDGSARAAVSRLTIGRERTESAESPDSSVDEDLGLVVGPHKPNALLEGQDADVAVVLGSIWADLVHPVTTWTGGALPVRGTLVVPHVDGLDRPRQRQLLLWIDGHANGERMQVISTCCIETCCLLQSRIFDAKLFYRLNVVHIVVRAQPRHTIRG